MTNNHDKLSAAAIVGFVVAVVIHYVGYSWIMESIALIVSIVGLLIAVFVSSEIED